MTEPRPDQEPDDRYIADLKNHFGDILEKPASSSRWAGEEHPSLRKLNP